MFIVSKKTVQADADFLDSIMNDMDTLRYTAPKRRRQECISPNQEVVATCAQTSQKTIHGSIFDVWKTHGIPINITTEAIEKKTSVRVGEFDFFFRIAKREECPDYFNYDIKPNRGNGQFS